MSDLGPGPLTPDRLAREIAAARRRGELSWDRGWWTFRDRAGQSRYQDSGEICELVRRVGPHGPFNDHARPCAVCRKPGVQLEPPYAYLWAADPCLGTLPGIISACCGHGFVPSAQAYGHGLDLSGEAAIEWLRKAVRVRDGGEQVGRPDSS